MDRQIVYPGAIPLETDLLNTNKYAMIGLAKLASALLGSNTYVHGLACTPTSPASMQVNVAPGQIYSLQNIDGTAYSSLAADTTHSILKQGLVLDATQFTLTAPATSGYSVNYLVQVTYTDTDNRATVLPYYNASNPAVAWSGPNNAGTVQNTIRAGVCTLALKAGVAATTGTQTTPSPDSGYTGLYVITVAQGATTVTASNIVIAANAPILPSGGLASAIQQCGMTYAADTGTANTYAAQFIPALPSLVDGMRLTFKAKTANTGASTFAANGGSAYPIYSHANQVLQGGEIVVNGLIEVEWNSSLTAWVLCGNSGGALPVAPATQSNHAVTFGQLQSRSPNASRYTSSGSFTVPAGVTTLYITGSAGGGGGGAGGGGDTTYYGGGGGGGGAGQSIIKQAYTVTPGATIGITIGAAGNGGVGNSSAGTNGSAGGATIVGSLVTLSGGSAGLNGGVGNTSAPGAAGGAGYPSGSAGNDGNNTVATGSGGVGANSLFGGAGGAGRAATTNGAAGSAAYGYGSGGGGGGGHYSTTSGVSNGGNGGNGNSGIVIIEW